MICTPSVLYAVCNIRSTESQSSVRQASRESYQPSSQWSYKRMSQAAVPRLDQAGDVEVEEDREVGETERATTL